ncbi:ABC transporter substrate-binding protein [Clostridium sp. D2Q-14]|uniref:siderophore ABC transporter substrate-binding protein n=1 Tax=Anaeromonas gelatinilytica TaxID=2683194 RepID=UPI00193C3648|nr:ABC transporter substrate-binding protein [Anaeromonas gelatinilytica]MBS4534042.1 ABC transporter substrate-binding protein [Anaeromonas gelatinilytica]
MKKSILSMVMASIMVFSLTACGQETATPSGTTTPADSETSAPQEDKTVTVKDATGEEVTVKVNPKRVAIYDLAILDILDTVGFDKTGIETLGLPKTESSLPDYLGEYRDNDKYVNVGTLFEADYDTLDLLQPNLIIGGGRFGSKNTEGKTIDDVKKRYPDAAYIELDIDLFVDDVEYPYEEGLKRNFDILSQIFPELKPGLDKGITELTQGFADIRAKSGDADTLFLMIGPGSISFYGQEGRYSLVHKEFGFKPADTTTQESGYHGAEVNAEYVKTENPKVILLLDRNASLGQEGSGKEFMANSLIQETDAYKNNNIYTLDNTAWYLLTGGYTSTKNMIADLHQYTDTLK